MKTFKIFFFCFSFTLLLASQRCMVKCLSWDLQGFSIPCMSHIVKNELVWGLIVSAPTGLISYRKLKVTLNLISNNQLPNPLQVGCGAIGCEMLKNYALLGVSRASGKVYNHLKIFANFKLEEKINCQFLGASFVSQNIKVYIWEATFEFQLLNCCSEFG